MIDLLGTSQIAAMSSSVYERGSVGPKNFKDATNKTTWCNQAIYSIDRKNGFNLSHFKEF